MLRGLGLEIASNFIPGAAIAKIAGKAAGSFPALMRVARAYSAGSAALAAKLTAARLSFAAKLVESGATFCSKVGRRIPGLNSFAPSTPVRTLTGLVAIGSLTIGTPVLAFNEQTGENGYYPITAVHKNIDPDITYLTINDPEQGNKPEFIETTPEHPFYVQEQVDSTARPAPQGHEELNTHWVGAGHLQIGDKIKQADGTVGVIANVVTLQQTQEMFNLTVSEAHTFYVGEQGWLVHNQTLSDHERYKQSLREQMERPTVKDRRLNTLMNDLYRPNATIGSGSSAAAVRFEASTGQPVGSKWHAEKATGYIRALEDWLTKNPKASPGDRAAAENVIKDMQEALTHPGVPCQFAR